MSRTYRRKNSPYSTRRFDVWGYKWTKYDWDSAAKQFEEIHKPKGWYGIYHCISWKYLDIDKVKDAKYQSDSMTSRFRKRWGKKYYAKQRRRWDQRELYKYHTEEYEPIFYTTKIDRWWRD